jgi:hypothetical protein
MEHIKTRVPYFSRLLGIHHVTSTNKTTFRQPHQLLSSNGRVGRRPLSWGPQKEIICVNGQMRPASPAPWPSTWMWEQINFPKRRYAALFSNTRPWTQPRNLASLSTSPLIFNGMCAQKRQVVQKKFFPQLQNPVCTKGSVTKIINRQLLFCWYSHSHNY